MKAQLFIVIFILFSTFSSYSLSDGQIDHKFFQKIDLKVKPRDPAYVKTVKKKLRDLKWEHYMLEKKCRADTKKYFVDNCARTRDKLSKRAHELAREIASTKP